jgi:hypothetical protein
VLDRESMRMLGNKERYPTPRGRRELNRIVVWSSEFVMGGLLKAEVLESFVLQKERSPQK